LRRTSELDSTGFLPCKGLHFWEFSEVWEVFAEGGDREDGGGPSQFRHHIHNERCEVWELEEFKDVGNLRFLILGA
jgi:hypothetical protein